MKVILCDLCGKSVPDTPLASIKPLTITYGHDAEIVESGDACAGCIEKISTFIKHIQILDDPKESIANSEPAKQEVPAIEPETGTRPDDSHPGEEIKPAVKQEAPKAPEPVTKICIHCHKPFTPKTSLAKTCSKYCSNHHWMDKQKEAKMTPEEKKAKQDALLLKLKNENPIRENREPSIYREM